MRNVYSGYHPLLFFASKCGYLSSFKRYGFRKPPYIELKARPKLGEREVTLVHVTDWIEKKLEQEFQKVFVMPNMDDVYIPIMHSAMDPRSTSSLLKDPPVEAGDQL